MLTLSDIDLDALLLAQVTDQWQKTAMVVAKAMMPHAEWDEAKIRTRIAALIENRKIECQGDIQNWRGSEVRLFI